MNAQPLLDMGSCGPLFPQQIGERDNEGITLITDNLCVAFVPDGIRVNERVFGDLASRGVRVSITYRG
jgi:hypothetical protein